MMTNKFLITEGFSPLEDTYYTQIAKVICYKKKINSILFECKIVLSMRFLYAELGKRRLPLQLKL